MGCSTCSARPIWCAMAGPRIAIKLKHARTNRQSIAYPFREGAETQDLLGAMALSPAQFSQQANAIGENCQHGRFQAQATPREQFKRIA